MNKNKEILISGFALFSMFFGAGNLIFPPTLGLEFGSQWGLSTLGFLATAVGFVMLGVLASSKYDGDISKIGNKVGPLFAEVFAFLVVLCIGPGLAIPRTGATTHELIEASLLPGVPTYLICGVFFLLVLYFSLSTGKVIDILGKYLTPVLLITLAIIIVRTILSPLGSPMVIEGKEVFGTSFEQGYQTMDCLAALMFTGVVIAGFKDQGYQGEELKAITKKAALIAGIGLAAIYGGLVYLGATVSSLNYQDLSRVELLIMASKNMLGLWGMIFLALAMSLACLTTAIGLIVTSANYFHGLSKGKISYKAWAVILVVISFALSLGGVEDIVKISGPILEGIYPVAITLIVANLLDKHIKKRSTYLGLSLGALIPAMSKILSLGTNLDPYGSFQGFFPDNLATFAWIPFTLVLGLLFSFLPSKRNKAI